MMTVTRIEELGDQVGQELGVSEWLDVTQSAVDDFAELTGDRQWIHTDPARARETPFEGTIAHGYYTLALAPTLLAQVVSPDRFGMALNYGLDRLRFPAPLPVGDRVRMRVRLDGVDEFPGGATLTLTLTFERAGGDKPVCLAQTVYRVFDR